MRFVVSEQASDTLKAASQAGMSGDFAALSLFRVKACDIVGRARLRSRFKLDPFPHWIAMEAASSRFPAESSVALLIGFQVVLCLINWFAWGR